MMDKNIKINMPLGAERIISTLQVSGYEAYAVGGCVRDSIMGKVPEDFDITTSALPEEIIKIFRNYYKVIPTGLKHGTVTLVGEDNSFYEVTTFRIDGEYSDCRHPDEVMFTSSLREDLARRDFTINAMAYSNKTGLADYFNGLSDIDKKLIRCVGNPDARFNEDALRMLRGIRFSAQLAFQIDYDTEKAIRKNAALIQTVSIERIQQEFNKLITNDPMKINDLWSFGLLKYFLPEFGLCIGVEQNHPYHSYCLDKHILESMCHIDRQVDLRLVMLFHDICKPQTRTTDPKGIDHFYNHGELSAKKAEEILKRMRYDNRTISRVSRLIKYHDTEIAGKRGIRRLLGRLGEEDLRDLIKVKEADILAQNSNFYHERHSRLQEIKRKLDEIIDDRDCFTVKDLKINGNDLIEVGFKPGKNIGNTLNWLLEAVIEEPELNEKEKLIKLAGKSLE